ncbi:MAG TPA: hypothetical protein VJ866_20205 [Pyrinomonadaceae bacterium]|nr:hypothetical protein [Pyrinomonadaceae bacterium]
MDKENGQVSPAVSLAERAVKILAGNGASLDALKARVVGENFFDFVGAYAVLSFNLFDELSEPDDVVNLHSAVACRLRPFTR